jgi:hypothetical protein
MNSDLELPIFNLKGPLRNYINTKDSLFLAPICQARFERGLGAGLTKAR